MKASWSQGRTAFGKYSVCYADFYTCYVNPFGPKQWAWYVVKESKLIAHGESSNVTGAKWDAIHFVEKDWNELGTLFDDGTIVEEEIIEKEVHTTIKSKKKREPDALKSSDLNKALWFIREMPSLDRAQLVFSAALAAMETIQ